MKAIKKINLLATVMGTTTFLIGNILQSMNMNEETGQIAMISGLNELTYFGGLILAFSIMLWLVFVDMYVFTDWKWFKTKTKADDIAPLIMFTVCIPILLSLIIFVFSDMLNWYNWYAEDAYEPMYKLIGTPLKHLDNKMEFWYILIAIISISTGLAIFFYKRKLSTYENKNQIAQAG